MHKTNQFRSLNLNNIQFDTPHKHQVQIVHPDKIHVIFDAHTKTKRLADRIKKSSQFRQPPPTQK